VFGNGTIRNFSGFYAASYQYEGHYWLMTPALDFGNGSKTYQFKFDIPNLAGDLTTIPDTDSLVVVVSEEGGETFNVSGIKKVFTRADGSLALSTGNIVSLTGLTGTRKIAFYFSIPDPNPATTLFVAVDNINIDISCPSVVSNPVVSDVTETSAKVAWEGPDDTEWLVFLREKGETAQEYSVVAAKDTTFTGLTAFTDYEVGITRSCAPGDTAQVVIVSFITSTDIECPKVTDITEVPTPNDVTISWETTRDAISYNVFIRPEGYEEGWITKKTTEKSIVIDLLEENVTYEYRIQAICSAAAGDESDSTAVRSFATPSATCFAPTNLLADPLAHRSATISWESEAGTFEFAWRKGTDEWTVETVEGTSKALTGLEPETVYSARVRTVCGEEDKSAWTAAYSFKTTAVPACPVPTALQATEVTAASALLSWEADDANLSWDVRFRPGSVTAWDTVAVALEVKTFLLEELTANTAYVWAVKATCEENSTTWIQGNSFTTGVTGIDPINSGAWSVYVSGKMINILNPKHAPIQRVRLYDTGGVILSDFTINANENVLIPTTFDHSVVIVKVEGVNTSKTFKVVIK
jgi:hypothetical protein